MGAVLWVQVPPTRSEAIAIVVTGTPIERTRLRRGGFPALMCDVLGPGAPELIELDAMNQALPDLRGFRAVLVTGPPPA